MEFSLLWAALTAVVLAWVGTRLWPEGLPERPTDRLVGAAAGGLLTGRIAAMLTQGTSPLLHPGDILVVRGGVHTGFATIGAMVTYLWSVNWRLAHLDAIAPAAIMGLAGWHTGCLWRGACLGAATELPWAWAGTGSDVTRHPVELYAALLLVGAAFLISRLGNRTLLRSGAALISAAAIRLITEPVRLSLTGGPIGWYLAAVVAGAVLMATGPALAGLLRLEPAAASEKTP